ncbi:unnamed protein product [Diatraea saccharalis]|uniref:Dipeptidylpeptidase IV N-terminal domain-containing protein n=1 Tax=Diatraea saccharalis TaxID=40085 RepID=A0A9N9R8P2_9NEOP|nr:unnamed protein product [Diatraea saccharalis]
MDYNVFFCRKVFIECDFLVDRRGVGVQRPLGGADAVQRPQLHHQAADEQLHLQISLIIFQHKARPLGLVGSLDSNGDILKPLDIAKSDYLHLCIKDRFCRTLYRELNAVDFKVSADMKFVLLISDVRPGWRHARLARYHVYDVINRNKIPISPVEDDRSAPLLQYAEWSPTGSSLVFVHDNDIYYKPRVLKTLVCRITNTGIPGVIFNGVPDFLYETEVLRLDRALWFSPDGQTLMFVTYNDSMVQQHKYPWYGLDQPEPPAYPSIRTLRYPKVNTNNPVVTIYVVSLKTPKFLFPHALQFSSQVDKSWYVRWSGWMSEKQVAVLLLNRPQNYSIISICSAVQYNCQDIYRDETDGTRWSGLGAEPDDEQCGWCGAAALLASSSQLTFPCRAGAARDGVFTSMPVADAGGTWRHAVRLTADSRSTLTQGNFEITSLLAWDDRRKFL